jgi:large subunit ribosomal protein L5
MAVAEAKVKPRLHEQYDNEIKPALIKRFGYSSPMQAPKIDKITVNMGVGDAKSESRILEAATEQLATITGQHPNERKSRKSIAQFKLREGNIVGVAVTLRGARMYEFLDRLISIAIPRIRDFRGLPAKFDGRGNYTLGVREQIIFPEIDYDAIDQVRGLDIVFTTTAKTDEEGYALLESFGFPFVDRATRAAEQAAAEPALSEEERQAKAEAEQAALEQLKEENPEAYATPPRASDEDEDAANVDGASDAPAREPEPGTADAPASSPENES